MPFKRNYQGKFDVPHKMYSFNLPEPLVSQLDTLPGQYFTRTQKIIAACENYIADAQADVDNSALMEMMKN